MPINSSFEGGGYLGIGGGWWGGGADFMFMGAGIF